MTQAEKQEALQPDEFVQKTARVEVEDLNHLRMGGEKRNKRLKMEGSAD